MTEETFTRTLKKKNYELTDHLGNVRSVITDMKVPSGSAFLPDATTRNYYYPFGMERPGMTAALTGKDYRFGYNGQEKVDEISPGHYTALFWEYDTRSIKRWNKDPKPNTSLGPYVVFENNPIIKTDFLGDSVKAYTETISSTGYLFRHAFLHVKTDKEDVLVELYGPDPNTTARVTGRPQYNKVTSSEQIFSRSEVEESPVTRPSNSPEGDYTFENKILKLAKFFMKVRKDESGRTDYVRLPEYGAAGPNSNGYAKALIELSGGTVELPINAPGENDTDVYKKEAMYVVNPVPMRDVTKIPVIYNTPKADATSVAPTTAPLKEPNEPKKK